MDSDTRVQNEGINDDEPAVADTQPSGASSEIETSLNVSLNEHKKHCWINWKCCKKQESPN